MPDPRFAVPTTTGTIVITAIALLSYWWIPVATFQKTYEGYSGERIMWAVISFAVGIFFMIGSDVQKFTHLSLKKGLISNGFFARTRNPNYFGEILIYGSFGIIANDKIACGILFTMWTFLFGSSFLMKEKSFMKKDGWNKYQHQSLILLPRLTGNYLLNYVIYGAVAFVAFKLYQFGGLTKLLA